MRLYLLRHADASYDAPSDEERELTPKGEQSIRDLCARLKPAEFERLPVILHSTLVRARQTAELFRDNLNLSAPLKPIPGLAPMDNPSSLRELLMGAREDMMIVGHNPHLSCLTAWLLTGDLHANVIEFKKSALLCLERGSQSGAVGPAGVWILQWFMSKPLI